MFKLREKKPTHIHRGIQVYSTVIHAVGKKKINKKHLRNFEVNF